MEFDVTDPPDSELFKFYLKQDSSIVDEKYAPSATLESEAPNQSWLDIPGYDGGTPLPYPGYLHSFDFKITGEKFFDVRIWGGVGGIIIGTEKVSEVNISLYVVLDSKGALYSMTAWASDSDGDGYEVPIYYSAGGDSFITLPWARVLRSRCFTLARCQRLFRQQIALLLEIGRVGVQKVCV